MPWHHIPFSGHQLRTFAHAISNRSCCSRGMSPSNMCISVKSFRGDTLLISLLHICSLSSNHKTKRHISLPFSLPIDGSRYPKWSLLPFWSEVIPQSTNWVLLLLRPVYARNEDEAIGANCHLPSPPLQFHGRNDTFPFHIETEPLQRVLSINYMDHMFTVMCIWSLVFTTLPLLLCWKPDRDLYSFSTLHSDAPFLTLHKP